MLTSINVEEVKKLHRYHTNNLNTNSILYTDDKYIYKIMYRFPENFEKTLEKISHFNFNFTIKPYHLIKDNNKYVGYSTLDTKEKTLFNYRHRPLYLKKKDLLLAFDLIDKLASNNMVYYDFHPGNVLVDRDFRKMTLCDLDCIRFIDEESDDDTLRNHYLRGFGLLLSYYYNVTGEEAEVAIMYSSNSLDEDNIFRDSMNYIGTDKLKEKVKRLGSMSEKSYRHYRNELVEVLNDRIRTGYYKGI